MRKLLLLSLLLSSSFLVSCGGQEDTSSSDGLTFNASSRTIILPGTDNSCEAMNTADLAQDVEEWRMAVNDLAVTWDKTGEDLTLIFLKIEIEHPNIDSGKYTNSISGIELDYLFGTVNGLAGSATLQDSGSVTNLEFDNHSASFLDQTSKSGQTKNPCRFVLGGIALVDDTVNFVTNGRITLVGTAKGNDKATDQIASGENALSKGEERSLKITKTIKVEFNFN